MKYFILNEDVSGLKCFLMYFKGSRISIAEKAINLSSHMMGNSLINACILE